MCPTKMVISFAGSFPRSGIAWQAAPVADKISAALKRQGWEADLLS
jgi:hypothetical protein